MNRRYGYLLFKPRNFVSGDFFYAYQKDNIKVVVVSDCTGHGVAGGLLTILGMTFLHEIIKYKNVFDPRMTLDLLREKFKATFNSFGNKINNGMDIALCFIYSKTDVM